MKVIELLSAKRDKYIVVPEYSKDFFLERKFILLPENNFLKKIILFLNINFLRKLVSMIYLFKKCKVKFFQPLHKKVVILDFSSSDEIIELLKSDEYTVLPTRVEDFSEILISKKIVFLFFKNLFKMSIKINYLSSLIEVINPLVIVTGIDTSADFFRISKIFSRKKAKTIVIQNSHKLNGELPETFHANYYFTYGDFEKTELKNYLLNTKTEAVGSLRAVIAKNYLIKKKISFEKKYDICLISEPHLMLNTDGFKKTVNPHKHLASIADFTIKFCKKHNKKLVFSGKADLEKNNDKNAELIFYENNLSEKNFTINFSKRKEFGTYKNIIQSELVIGFNTSCLRESFGLNRKTLCCDFANSEDTRFPGKGIHILNESNFHNFEERVLKLLEIDYEEYLLNIKNLNAVYNKNADTMKVLQGKLTNL